MHSPNREYLKEIDQLRGLAACLVFWYHCSHSARTALGGIGWPVASTPFTAVIWEGHSGVSLFFVLSGFILTYGTFDRDISYWGFLRNRALRIFPLVITVLMFSIYGSTGIDFGQIAASFLLLKNTSAAFSDPSQIAGTVWTVAVEFQIYLITPFIILFVGRNGFRQFLLPLMILVWFCRLIIVLGAPDHEEMQRISYFTGAGRINQFLIGVGLAYLIHTGFVQAKWARTALVVGSVGVLSLLWTMNVTGGGTHWSFWRLMLPEVEATFWAIFLFGFLAVRPLGESVVAKISAQIGLLSFSIYILHYAIQRLFWYKIFPKHFSGIITNPVTATLANLVIFALVLWLSLLSYRCIERPFLAMRSRYLSERTKSQCPA